jgi:hypothetical protein
MKPAVGLNAIPKRRVLTRTVRRGLEPALLVGSPTPRSPSGSAIKAASLSVSTPGPENSGSPQESWLYTLAAVIAVNGVKRPAPDFHAEGGARAADLGVPFRRGPQLSDNG